MTNNNSQKSFRYAMINLSLVAAIVVTSFVMVFLRFYSEGLSVVIGLLVFAIGILSVIGSICAFGGWNEPRSVKKTIGMVLNLAFLGLFLSVIIANIIDLYKAFS